MIRSYVRLVRSWPRDLPRARWVTMGVAVLVWVSIALLIAVLEPRGAMASVARDRQARAEGASSELREYLSDRLAILRFVAALPTVSERGARTDEVLRGFNAAYPEFSRVYVTDQRPSSGRTRPLYLAAPLANGGYVIGLLKSNWTDGRFLGVYRFREMPDGARTVLVSRSGARTATSAPPPDWNVLQKLAKGRATIARWGDGQPYITSVVRLSNLPNPRPTLLVVCAVPVATVAAKIATFRWGVMIAGLLTGLVTGGVGCIVLGWATRWLRRANEELESRVAERTAELAAAERSFRGIFENAPLGLYQCDPDGRFLQVNPALAQILGYESPEATIAALGSLQALGEPTLRGGFLDSVRSERGVAETTTVVTRVDGRTVWLAEHARAVRDERGALVLIEGAMNDVTAERELESQLRRLGETDPLTGLLNRRGLDEAIASAEMPVSFVALDVDRFKAYNDSYGHPAGDHALRTVAEALRLTVRGNDAVGRAGGEEFVVVLPQTGAAGALRVAEALRAAVQACGGLEIRLTISGGVATARTRDEVDEAFAAADRALYMAKEAGRNRIVVNQATLA